jgi:cytoskeletal protein CcmA (bactofilin family)
MAWFGRSPRASGALFKDRPSPILSPSVPAESTGEGLVAYLYRGSRVTGQLILHGTARIDGVVDGQILCHGRLTIGEGAEIRANVSGDVVVIHGQVEGDVTAKERVELGAPARLLGNIEAPRLVVADGVSFDGGCAMRGARELREVPIPPGSNIETFESGPPKLATMLEK